MESECPEIPPDLMFYWTAYQDLSTERPQGGYFAIPYFKILEYARAWRADIDLLKLMIWGIDGIYLDYWKEKSAQSKPGTGVPYAEQNERLRRHGR